jgi:hypothetical protein
MGAPQVSDLAYSTHGVGIFHGVSDAGGLVSPIIGLALIGTGTTAALMGQVIKANLTREKPDFIACFAEAILNLIFLSIYTWIAHTVWTATQDIALGIYPDSKLTAAMKLLGGVALRYKDYSYSLLGIGAALKDSIIIGVAMLSWALTLLAHWQLDVLQVAVYNVVLAFGPILIGLQAFGFNTRRLWLAAVIEVSSWSITMAVVYRSIDGVLTDYLTAAAGLDFTDVRFLDVISMLAFLSSLPFIVPLVTGRLLGTQALGALSAVSFGSTVVDSVVSKLRNTMSRMGGGASPGTTDASAHTAPTAARPGDH